MLTDGRIVPLAGRDSNCNCLDASCQCFERDTYLATNTIFSAISSITVSPDSTLYVADQGNARVRSVGSSLAASGGGDREAEANGVFEVPDPEANQVCNQKNIVKGRGGGADRGGRALLIFGATKTVRFQLTYNQGLRQLFFTLSRDLRA